MNGYDTVKSLAHLGRQAQAEGLARSEGEREEYLQLANYIWETAYCIATREHLPVLAIETDVEPQYALAFVAGLAIPVPLLRGDVVLYLFQEGDKVAFSDRSEVPIGVISAPISVLAGHVAEILAAYGWNATRFAVPVLV